MPSSSAAATVVRNAHSELAKEFAAIDWRTHRHLARVLDSLRRHRVGSAELNAGLDGYAHGDIGREAIDKVYADVMGAEAALVRSQIFSGTHAIACALFAVLRPGDTMLAVSGAPYDTLEEVIGLRAETGYDDDDDAADNAGSMGDAFPASTRAPPPDCGSLIDWGVGYSQVELDGSTGGFDLAAIDSALAKRPSVRLLHVQRSCGYLWRPSLPIAEIARLCAHVDAINERRRRANQERGEEPPERLPQLVVFVDNCYGEFAEEQEPCAVGAHLVAGSLIKNPGGTLARTGGYVAGRRDLVRLAANRLSAPGVHGGATLGQNKAILQGLFNAPGSVGESMKGAMLMAQVLGGSFGLPCNPPPPIVDPNDLTTDFGGPSAQMPRPSAVRTDIIQAVQLGSAPRLRRFCEAVQRHCPVDAHVKPTPGRTPGYGDEVIFADGSFVDGATSELSADGPLREPFTVFAQGGTHVMHWALVLEAVIEDMGLFTRCGDDELA